MSEQIDWSKAPEGCIGRGNIGAGHFYVWFSDRWYEYVDSNHGGRHYFGDIYVYREKDIVSRTHRPAAPSWPGEGLPPVGVVCELRCLPVGGWGKAEIKYMSETQCVWRWLREDGGYQVELAEVPDVTRMAFRPIRTQEQIAADEREAAVNGMLCYDALGGSRRGLAEALYDAGYRKP